MRKRKPVNNYTEGHASNVDCTTCAERRNCDSAQENSFCGKWHSKTVEREGKDPNLAWVRGEKVDF